MGRKLFGSKCTIPRWIMQLGTLRKSPKVFKKYWKNGNCGPVERNCSLNAPSHAARNARGGKTAKIASRAQDVNLADGERTTVVVALQGEFVIIASVEKSHAHVFESNCVPSVRKGRKKAVSNVKVYQLSVVQVTAVLVSFFLHSQISWHRSVKLRRHSRLDLVITRPSFIQSFIVS